MHTLLHKCFHRGEKGMSKQQEMPKLEEVISKAIQAIEQSKTEIFEIAEISRNESERLKLKLLQLQEKIGKFIDKLDRLEKLEKEARFRLMTVSRDIKRYNEEDIRKAYENASNLQADVRVLRNQEKQLIEERAELEKQFLRNRQTVAKAETLVSKVGVVLDFLGGNMQGINDKLEEIEARGNLGARIIKAQEEERRRVAREIHDGPAQSMANIVLRAEFCERLIDKDIEQAKKELGHFKQLVRENLKDVRKIIYDLRPMVLDDLGLIPALSRYTEDFKVRYNINVEFVTSQNNIRLPNTLEVAIFRVIQEALQNVYKHAFAKRALVKVDITDEKVQAFIRDDGKGFNIMEVFADKEREGYGLLGMRERVELLSGTVNFYSQTGRGTEITIEIPLQNSDGEVE